MKSERSDNELDLGEGNSLKDYLRLIREYLISFILIIIICSSIAVIYAIRLPDIYVSNATVRITKSDGSILKATSFGEVTDFGNDRFINNEIEILRSYNLREKVARTLRDSANQLIGRDNLSLISSSQFGSDKKVLLSEQQIVGLLSRSVSIGQKKGLDIIVISAESPSPNEAALMAKLYAETYKTNNLEISRDQLTYIRNFLDEQRAEKQNQLSRAEDSLRSFQEKGGIISFDEQARMLITTLSDFESKLNAAKIELTVSEQVLLKYKDALTKQDPKLADYLESVTSETYIKALQNQISELQLNKDLALSKLETGVDISEKVKENDSKIRELKTKLDEKIKILKSGILASSPEEVRILSQKIIEAEVNNQALRSSVASLETIVKRYEERFNKLPKTTIEMARYQRSRESTEKLFTLIEAKYQEALINEQSQAGNVLIIDNARIPGAPAKPNRFLIGLIGFLIGSGLSLGFIFTKNYFDDTIKTPEEIEKKNMNVLAWIPKVEGLNGNSLNGTDFVIERNPNSLASESFRALRTRIQFSKLPKETLKTILITSPAPQDGKSTIAVNLAGSFAHTNRKTLLIDCDLRKPRLHQIFKKDKEPGLVNFLFDQVSYENILIKTDTKNLFLITSGAIVVNPSEILESLEMDNFLKKVREQFDCIIIDSPPIVAVTDAEILASKVDGTILVASFKKTESGLLDRGLQLLKHDQSFLIGAVLNNFASKSGYGSYYKYYYYYSSEGDKKFRKKNKPSKDSET